MTPLRQRFIDDLRLRNYTGDDQLGGKPYTSPDSLRECYTRVTDAFGWQQRGRREPNGSMRRGESS